MVSAAASGSAPSNGAAAAWLACSRRDGVASAEARFLGLCRPVQCSGRVRPRSGTRQALKRIRNLGCVCPSIAVSA